MLARPELPEWLVMFFLYLFGGREGGWVGEGGGGWGLELLLFLGGGGGGC